MIPAPGPVPSDRADQSLPGPVQDPAERSQAEQYLRVFSLSTEYVSHCKVCRSDVDSVRQTQAQPESALHSAWSDRRQPQRPARRCCWIVHSRRMPSIWRPPA